MGESLEELEQLSDEELRNRLKSSVESYENQLKVLKQKLLKSIELNKKASVSVKKLQAALEVEKKRNRDLTQQLATAQLAR